MLTPWDRAPWSNWVGDIVIDNPERHYHPTSLDELAAIVREAGELGRRVRASGSHWAYADVAVADWFVETKALNATLQHVVPEALDPTRVADPDLLLHVEAGITIRELNLRLDGRDPSYPVKRRLALPTMGGASGQTIAGAISTGTHGGDHALPPLADFVRAIHLVAPDGRQHWIEREPPLTEQARLAEPLPGVEIHYDSALLDATLLSVGRAGIVYSLVIEVVDQFWLLQHLTASTWERTKPELTAPFIGFEHPHPGGAGPPSRFVEVVLGPYKQHDHTHPCYVTRRWQVGKGQGPPRPRRFDLFTRICAHRKILVVVGPSVGQIIAAAINVANRIHLSATVRALGARLLRSFRPTDTFVDVGYEVMDLKATGGECYRGDSIELAFDASAGAHVTFVDEVVFPAFEQYARHGWTVGGYVSLRFTRRSSATLAMQRWERTCSIEVAVLTGVRGNHDILQSLQDAAVARGGTVHWGQRNTTTEADVRQMYPDLHRWQAALAELGLQPGDVFDNDFCRKRGLEPITDIERPPSRPRTKDGRP